MAQCTRCQKKLGLLERITGNLCKGCEDEVRRERTAARATYSRLVQELAAGTTPLQAAIPALEDVTPKARFGTDELIKIHRQALSAYVERVLADEVLTEDEEKQFVTTTEALGLSMDDLSKLDQTMMIRLVVAQANAGRLTVIPENETRLLCKKGEVVHLQVQASLMKEVTKREYVGGYAGMSFRIVKGMRFHTGGARGRSVVTGTEIQVEDTGGLIVSSQRAVFMGQRKSIEMPYTKVMGINVFTDGIQFNLSNRQRAPMFQVPSGELVAAIVNAAAQKALDSAD